MAFTETQAVQTFLTAIHNEQAAELLNTLIEGGGFTQDVQTGRLIMINEAMLKEILETSEND